ncbi:MAG: SdpI family protein [Planctomycetota bacterium]|jgi:uncharacterized membrane protein
MLAEIDEAFLCKVICYITFIFCGLLFIGLAIPMVLRKIPPNQWYGWRAPKAFENPEVWYEINWYSGRDLMVIGIVQVLFNLVLLCFDGQLGNLVNYLMVPGNLLIITGGTVMMIIRGVLYLRKL